MVHEMIKIEGMSCKHCVLAVTEAVKELKGIQKIEVDLASGKAEVDFEEQQTTLQAIKNKIIEAGYRPV